MEAVGKKVVDERSSQVGGKVVLKFWTLLAHEIVGLQCV
jgi:hypothetical protein